MIMSFPSCVFSSSFSLIASASAADITETSVSVLCFLISFLGSSSLLISSTTGSGSFSTTVVSS